MKIGGKKVAKLVGIEVNDGKFRLSDIDFTVFIMMAAPSNFNAVRDFYNTYIGDMKCVTNKDTIVLKPELFDAPYTFYRYFNITMAMVRCIFQASNESVEEFIKEFYGAELFERYKLTEEIINNEELSDEKARDMVKKVGPIDVSLKILAHTYNKEDSESFESITDDLNDLLSCLYEVSLQLDDDKEAINPIVDKIYSLDTAVMNYFINKAGKFGKDELVSYRFEDIDGSKLFDGASIMSVAFGYSYMIAEVFGFLAYSVSDENDKGISKEAYNKIKGMFDAIDKTSNASYMEIFNGASKVLKTIKETAGFRSYAEFYNVLSEELSEYTAELFGKYCVSEEIDKVMQGNDIDELEERFYDSIDFSSIGKPTKLC